MTERKESHVIVKRMKQGDKYIDIVLIDSHSEVWEFDDKEKAQEIADILSKNSDSGWDYYVRTTK